MTDDLVVQASAGAVAVRGGPSVCRRGTTHGMNGDKVLLKGEDPEEFEEHAAAFVDAYRPQGKVEEELTRRICILAWRLRRIERIEAESWDELARRQQLEVKIGENTKVCNLAALLMEPPTTSYLPIPSGAPMGSPADDEAREKLREERRAWVRRIHEAQVVEWTEALQTPSSRYGLAAVSDRADAALRMLCRYETALQRGLYVAMMHLEHLQRDRR